MYDNCRDTTEHIFEGARKDLCIPAGFCSTIDVTVSRAHEMDALLSCPCWKTPYPEFNGVHGRGEGMRIALLHKSLDHRGHLLPDCFQAPTPLISNLHQDRNSRLKLKFGSIETAASLLRDYGNA